MKDSYDEMKENYRKMKIHAIEYTVCVYIYIGVNWILKELPFNYRQIEQGANIIDASMVALAVLLNLWAIVLVVGFCKSYNMNLCNITEGGYQYIKVGILGLNVLAMILVFTFLNPKNVQFLLYNRIYILAVILGGGLFVFINVLNEKISCELKNKI